MRGLWIIAALTSCAVERPAEAPSRADSDATLVWESRTQGLATLAPDGSIVQAASGAITLFAKAQAEPQRVAELSGSVQAIAAGTSVIYATHGKTLVALSRHGETRWHRELCCAVARLQIAGDDGVAFYAADGFHWYAKDGSERLAFPGDHAVPAIDRRTPSLVEHGISIIPWYSTTPMSSVRACKDLSCTTHATESALVSDPLRLSEDGAFAIIAEELSYTGERAGNFFLRRYAADMTEQSPLAVKPTSFSPLLVGERIVTLTDACRVAVVKGGEEPAAPAVTACTRPLARGGELFVLREHGMDGWVVSVVSVADLSAKDYALGALSRPTLLSVDGERVLVADGALKLFSVPLRSK